MYNPPSLILSEYYSMPSYNANKSSDKTSTSRKQSVEEDGLSLSEIPEAPDFVSGEALLYWHFYCTILLDGRCLRRPYLTSIQNLCILHMMRIAYMEEINKDGVCIETHSVNKDGFVTATKKPNPVCDKLDKLINSMDRILASLGLTAYTDKVLQYDSSGIAIGSNTAPPTVDFDKPTIFTPKSKVS